MARLLEYDVLAGDIASVPPEGALLPDTYRVVRGTQRQDLIRRMSEARNAVLQRAWARRVQNLPLRSPEELMILASIVEKETGKADERTRVAAVFINRLNRRMRLESDPTIIYGLVGGQGSLGRPILASEIRRPTPFNTYVIDGLPPTPIANPGRASIEATANPSRTNELFFVADGTGGHVFAETYAEHQQNVARWRQIERARTGAPPAVAPPAQASPPAAPPAAAPRAGQQQRTQAAPPAAANVTTGTVGTPQNPRRIEAQPSTPRQ